MDTTVRIGIVGLEAVGKSTLKRILKSNTTDIHKIYRNWALLNNWVVSKNDTCTVVINEIDFSDLSNISLFTDIDVVIIVVHSYDCTSSNDNHARLLSKLVKIVKPFGIVTNHTLNIPSINDRVPRSTILPIPSHSNIFFTCLLNLSICDHDTVREFVYTHIFNHLYTQ